MKSQKSKIDWIVEHPLVKHIGLALAASVVVLIIVFVAIRIYARHGKEVELPDMEGRLLSEVMQEDRYNLRFEIMDSVYKEGLEGGIILLQDPKGGDTIKPGRKVYITITSFAIEAAIVPDLQDLGLRQASSRLANAGLECGSLTFVSSDYATVQSMSCKGKNVFAGQELPHGSRVDLVIGTGSNSKLAAIPQLLGKTPSYTRHVLHSASLNVGREHYDADVKDRSKAVVYRQEPAFTGMADYPLGTSVELWYGVRSQAEIDEMLRNFVIDESQRPDHDLNDIMDDLIEDVYDNWGDDW